MVENKQWSAPSLEQMVELAEGTLPREFENVDELTPHARRVWEGVSPSFQVGSRANHSALQENVRRLVTSVISGQRSSESFARLGPNGCFWKMCVGCSQQPTLPLFRAATDVSTVCAVCGRALRMWCETWPKWGTAWGGDAMELATLALRIKESESSLWRTPTAEDCQNRGFLANSRGEPKLSAQVKLLPTPSTVDSGSYFNRSKSAGAAKRPTLGAMARYNLFPTPQASMMTMVVDMVQAQFAGIDPTWPTPNATDGDKAPKCFARGNLSLPEAVKRSMFPTPKSSPSDPDFARVNREGTGGDDLATAIARETNGSLNPTWVELLMGFPPGWTNLED